MKDFKKFEQTDGVKIKNPFFSQGTLKSVSRCEKLFEILLSAKTVIKYT